MAGRESGFLISGWRRARRSAGLFRLTSVVLRGLLWVIVRPVAWQADDNERCL